MEPWRDDPAGVAPTKDMVKLKTVFKNNQICGEWSSRKWK